MQLCEYVCMSVHVGVQVPESACKHVSDDVCMYMQVYVCMSVSVCVQVLCKSM